jgi:hypothetical protein
MAVIEVAQLNQKPQKISSYACHICDLNGHKMKNCPKFTKMRKIFHRKLMRTAKVQLVAKTLIVTSDVNVVDVNVIKEVKQLKNRCSRIESQGK